MSQWRYRSTLVVAALLAIHPGIPTSASAAAAPSIAEKTDKADDEGDVDTVVVTATRLNVMVRDEPIRVEVVPEEEIEENLTIQPGNLSTLLNELGGVRIQTTAPGLNGATLQMRGLSGRHTLVLQDGLPSLGAQTDAFGLLQTPPLDLGQVEVIKGVGSTLYGGSGLGGVLNLVSRRPGSEPEVLLNRTSRGGTDAIGFTTGALSPALGFTLTAGAHDQTREDIDHDAWAEVARYRRYTLRPRLFYDDGDGGSVFATLGVVDEEREGGTLPDRTLSDGTTFTDSLNTRRIDGGAVVRSTAPDTRHWDLRLSATRTEHERQFGTQFAEDTQTTAYAEGTLGGSDRGHAWLLGLALEYDRLESDDGPNAAYRYVVPGAFAQDEYSPTDAVTLAASARVDVHNDYGTFVSPRLSALFRLRDDWSLRASIGSGFAAPTPVMEETQATTLALLEPMRDLEAERAVSASLDSQWIWENWEINASVFGSEIRDPLVIRDASTPGRLQLANADGPSRAVGAELLVHYVTGELHVIGNSTYLDATEDALDSGRRDSELVPRLSGELAALLEDEERGRLGLEISYTGVQQLFDNPYRTESEEYVEINALAELKLGEVAVFLNGINLTDQRQTRVDPLLRPAPAPTGERIVDVWAPLAGRVFNLGVRIEL
jgi:outer membrane receptor for ferrienterochelin and colicins